MTASSRRIGWSYRQQIYALIIDVDWDLPKNSTPNVWCIGLFSFVPMDPYRISRAKFFPARVNVSCVQMLPAQKPS